MEGTKSVEISAEMVKKLRELSGAAIMDCKNALVEAAGDFEKAFEVLRQRGIASAAKKATRSVSEGLVTGKISADGKVGALTEIACETDFVARNPEFVTTCTAITETALKHHPATIEELLKLTIEGGPGTVKDFISEKISKTGENIVVQRISVMDLGSKPGAIGLYIHTLGGKMGALLKLESTAAVDASQASALAREVAMHAVSAKPQFLRRDQVPKEIIENEHRIESGKADLADKKPEIREKIITGRVDKIIAERCLLEQPFVKDPSKSVAQYLKEKGQPLGAEFMPTELALFILGESQDQNRNGAD
jgi:elongation factor Ts